MKTKIIFAIATLLAFSGSTAHAQFLFGTAAGANSGSASDLLAGVRAGYNWQNSALVYGLETDLSATHLDTNLSTALAGTIIPPPTASTTSSIDWYGTLRGRLGWSTGPVLFYGTGGVAYGNVTLSSALAASGAGGAAVTAQTSDTGLGWVAGGGVEYKLSPNVILSAAYQYVDLGTLSLTSSLPGAFFGLGSLSQSASAHAQFQVATIGLSVLFPPSGGSHGPWEGGYFGLNLGGDWGNSTSANYAVSQPILLSDVRLKRDIVLVGHLDNGLGLYRFRYLWSDEVLVGVMAQEVAKKVPSAVVVGYDGFLRVNYQKLGLKMCTLAEWEAKTCGVRLN
jgi:outer membrane immunogenic protein